MPTHRFIIWRAPIRKTPSARSRSGLPKRSGRPKSSKARNEIGDLQTRVDALRTQQQALRERLVPVLEKRRTVEQLFAELDSREHDIDNVLAEIASGDDAIAIDVRLSGLSEFVRRGHERCDEIEQASDRLGSLKQDYADLHETACSLCGGGRRRHAPRQGIKRGARPAGGGDRVVAADARRAV